MIRVDGVVGNVREDEELAARRDEHAGEGTLEETLLEPAQRKKSRLRVETDAGTDLGVLVDQPELRAGDVLVEADERMVVVAFESREALAVDLPAATPNHLETAVEFGHRVGNQHWDIAVEDGTVYVPVDVERRILEDVLGPYLPGESATWYEPVDAGRFIDGPETGHGTGERDHTGHNVGESHDHSHGEKGGHDHGHTDDGETEPDR